MLGIVRRVFSFVDWERHNPNAPPPGDMLDASFDAQNARIGELEDMVMRVVRSDGALQNAVVGRDSLHPALRVFLQSEMRDTVAAQLKAAEDIRQEALGMLGQAKQIVAELRAINDQVQAARDQVLGDRAGDDARLTAAADQTEAALRDVKQARNDYVATANDAAGAAATAEVWAEASWMWAEWMPDSLPDNAVKMMDVSGDHWSSRWWANQAANAFGMLTSLYLGVHSDPPVTNANGGPIQVGAIYYDSDDHQMYVWTGSAWETMSQPQRAGMMTLWYRATAGQTVFPMSTADLHGTTFVLNSAKPEQLDVHVNGIKLMPVAGSDGDWSVNVATSTVTLLRALRAGDMVAIDVLMPVNQLGPGNVHAFALAPLTGQDGSKLTFALAAVAPGVTVTVNKSEELIVSLDGVIQQPAVSYTAAGASITFAQAPAADAKTFITWFRSDGGTGVVARAA